jgi:hypothetical protein
MINNQEIGAVAKALKNGQRASRMDWAKRGEYIFRQVPSSIAMEVVPKMTSLPEAVKKSIINSELPPNYINQIAYVGQNGDISSYTFSAEDILADDWIILD